MLYFMIRKRSSQCVGRVTGQSHVKRQEQSMVRHFSAFKGKHIGFLIHSPLFPNQSVQPSPGESHRPIVPALEGEPSVGHLPTNGKFSFKRVRSLSDATKALEVLVHHLLLSRCNAPAIEGSEFLVESF